MDTNHSISSSSSNQASEDLQDIAYTVFDAIRFVKDPEKDSTLEDLAVLQEDKIKVRPFQFDSQKYLVDVEFVPTVPHCSLATLIGLCIRIKLERTLPYKPKLFIHVSRGTHDAEDEVNKQINDKERVAAALENPNLRKLVEDCIADEG